MARKIYVAVAQATMSEIGPGLFGSRCRIIAVDGGSADAVGQCLQLRREITTSVIAPTRDERHRDDSPH
jgi:hypothetical protein